jgi:hypothetical protein
MTNEYYLHPVSPSEAARIAFPITLPLSEREAYMAAPPVDVIAAAERVAHDSRPPAPPAETPDVADPLPSDED